MRKSIKWLGAILCILVLLVVLAAVCIVTFVNPNRFKPLIAEQVMKHTGRQLLMEGDLSWSLFPCLGIKTGHVVLSNPAGFPQKIFAEVQHATIGVKLLPLLHKKIESSGIYLDGLKLNLIRDAAGKNNWQFQSQVTGNVKPAVTQSSNEDQIKVLSAGLLVSAIEVSNAEINWKDTLNNQYVSIEKLNIKAKNISAFKPFSVLCDFDLINKNPALLGHIKLSGEVSMNADQEIFSFRDFVMNAAIQQGNKKYAGRLAGDVTADLQKQTLQWTNFHGQIGRMDMTGKINVVDLIKSPHASGQFQIQPFDLKEFLQSTGQDLANVQTLKNMSGNLDFTAAAHAVNVQGKFKIDTIEAKHVKLNHVVIPLHYQIGILELAPITADFYQGTLQTNAKVNMTSAVPQMAIQSKLSNVRIESLLQDLGGSDQKLKLMGLANMTMQVTTLISDSDAIVKNLNGTGSLNVSQGVLQGIDIGYLIDSANAVLKHQAPNAKNTQQTTFDSLTGTVVIRDGVVVNDDLMLNSPRFKTTGKGTIDLVAQKIDYHLQTLLNQSGQDQKNDWGNLYGLPIPISINGKLKDPSINLDTSVLAKAIANQQIKKIESKVEDQIKEKVSGKAGEMLQNLLGH